METTPLTVSRMALPPHDMPGVVIVLTTGQSYLFLDWLTKSATNLENAIAEAMDTAQEVNTLTYQMLSTMALGMQSCHSAAAASAIYDNAEPDARRHFIHLNQFDAVTIIQMLEHTGSDVANELHATIIQQVDNAFIKKDVFANLLTLDARR